MRKLLVLTSILFLLADYGFSAGPRTWGKSGTAGAANSTVTVGGTTTFGPLSVCIVNTDTTDDLFADWTDGIATTDDNSTNMLIKAGATYCADFKDLGTRNVVEIGLIRAAAADATYNIIAIGRN